MNRRALLTSTAAALCMATGWNAAFAQEVAEADAAQVPAVTEMVLGNPDAAVEVTEYASFTCPHCARFSADQFPQIKANYIDTGKIRFVYREVYFDRFGLWASMIARCGDNTQRFFGISEVLYEKQRDWTAGGDPAQIAANLRQIGKIAGLDDASLDACMSDGENAQALVSWFEENSFRDEINSTPSFMIQGEKYSNMTYPDFADILDKALAEAGDQG